MRETHIGVELYHIQTNSAQLLAIPSHWWKIGFVIHKYIVHKHDRKHNLLVRYSRRSVEFPLLIYYIK